MSPNRTNRRLYVTRSFFSVMSFCNQDCRRERKQQQTASCCNEFIRAVYTTIEESHVRIAMFSASYSRNPRSVWSIMLPNARTGPPAPRPMRRWPNPVAANIHNKHLNVPLRMSLSHTVSSVSLSYDMPVQSKQGASRRFLYCCLNVPLTWPLVLFSRLAMYK